MNDRRIAVIGDKLLTTGMSLAGIKHIYSASTGEDAERLVKEIAADQEVGLVVMQQGLIEQIKDRKVLNMIDGSLSPIFLGVPGFKEEERNIDTLRRLILRAIGIDIQQMK